MIARAITPLRLIFWGGLICVFDFNLSATNNGTGLRVDVISDVIGFIMILVGVSRLARLSVHHRYWTAMKFVKVIAALSILNAIREHFILPPLAPVELLIEVFELISLAAVITFCVAMRWLSSAANLVRSEASWRTTTILFIVLYAIPSGILTLLRIPAIAGGRPLHIDLGPAGCLLFLFILIPLVHLFVSTSRMRYEIEMMVGQAYHMNHPI